MLDLVLPFPQQSRFIREALEHGLAVVQRGEMGMDGQSSPLVAARNQTNGKWTIEISDLLTKTSINRRCSLIFHSNVRLPAQILHWYGRFTYKTGSCMGYINVGKYFIHGAFGWGKRLQFAIEHGRK